MVAKFGERKFKPIGDSAEFSFENINIIEGDYGIVLCSVPLDVGPTQTHISRYAIKEGGTRKNANEDYSVIPAQYSIAPPDGHIYRIHTIIVYIEDSTKFYAEGYGSDPGLTNGIHIKLLQGNTVVSDITDGVPIMSNADWSKICCSAMPSIYGAGNEMMQASWSLSNSGGPIRLCGDHDDKITFYLNDNLSGLINHYFLFQGVEESKF